MFRIGAYGLDAIDHGYVIGKFAKSMVKGEMREYLANPGYYSTVPKCIKAIRDRMRHDYVKANNGNFNSLTACLKDADAEFTRLLKDSGLEVDPNV